MQTFISETLELIHNKHDSLEDVMIILPSQRAKVFVREECKHQVKIGFLPVIYSIEDFVCDVSGFDKIDTIQLLFNFYKIYKRSEENAQSFDLFSSWAITALQDFNEADQHLVDTKDLFNYIRDIKRLHKWSIEGEVVETEMMKNHYSFTEKLGVYYDQLFELLSSKKKGYQGLLFRKALEKIEDYFSNNSTLSIYFVGFNALTKSEEMLIQKVLQHSSSDIFWDIDETFLNSNHQAGSFLRNYLNNWTYFESNELKTISSHFNESKNIEVIGATKNVTQIKEVGNILNSIEDYRNTALVLGDESLLPVVLNSIPEKVPSINITMGYSLKDIPTYQFVKDYFELYMTREKLNIKNYSFYHKTLLKFFKNGLITTIFSDNDDQTLHSFSETIIKENISFVPIDFIHSEIKISAIQKLFQKEVSIDGFIHEILAFFDHAKDLVSDIEKEYIYRFYNAFTQLNNLNQEYDFFKDLKTLYQFFKQVISKEVISFQGEPLSGLQCMGVLETRVLDFENLIITSVNEGVIPKNSLQSSFIPFDVKIHFKLPTYKEKDAIFSYHFFRLLQRAKNIYILYNTENDNYGNGEKSRFLSQLELLREDIQYKSISPIVPSKRKQRIEIEKTNEILDILKERAKKGFSPSAIGSYLYNPIEFYKQRVLGLHNKEEVEETLAANTMGTIVHKSLELLYTPYLNKYLTTKDIEEMEKITVKTVDRLFPKYFRKGDFKAGKNKIMYEIIVSYIFRFLSQEKDHLSQGKSLKVLEVEKQLETDFELKELDFPIRFYGEIDRIDELDGVLRIIDYKTGLVTSANMGIPNDWNLNDYKHSKAIQVLMYAYLFQKNYQEKYETLQAGNISFKKLSSGFIPVSFGGSKETKHQITKDRLEEFQESLGSILKEIFNQEIPFVEKEK